jgi:predicted nucleotidyltransferase
MHDTAIPADVTTAIRTALARIETDHRIRVLHAAESGSRAWGFASPDSDFDARFIYAHDVAWYLTVLERTRPGQPQRDVIEQMLPGDLDVSGWDLRKALALVAQGNATPAEWLRSPIVYAGDAAARERLRALVDAAYRPLPAWHHYRSMAARNARTYLGGERVRLKKYFYVLRPLLCAQWLASGRGVPPMEFATLLDTLLPDGPVRAAVETLLEAKRATAELGDGAAMPIIDAFVAAALGEAPPALPDPGADYARLDAGFRELVGYLVL